MSPPSPLGWVQHLAEERRAMALDGALLTSRVKPIWSLSPNSSNNLHLAGYLTQDSTSKSPLDECLTQRHVKRGLPKPISTT
eukprot:393190-Amphidinium_carterae.1